MLIKRAILLPFITALGFFLQSCNLPLQNVGLDDPSNGQYPSENTSSSNQLIEPIQAGEVVPEGMLPGGNEIFFAAGRTLLPSGECVGLEWNTHGMDTVRLNGELVESVGFREVCPVITTVYVLEVESGPEKTFREVVIEVRKSDSPAGLPQPENQTPPQVNSPIPTVGQPPVQNQAQTGCAGAPVIYSFSANPATINAGQSSTLKWDKVTNGTSNILVKSVLLDPGFGEVGSPGSRVVKPVKTTTYILKASGCGGTATRTVTVVVNAGSNPQSGADLAITDLYAQSLPKGGVWVRITNNGPQGITNEMVDLKCTLDKTDFVGGAKSNVAKDYPVSFTLDLSAGQTKAFNTNTLVDTTNHWFQIVCTVHAQNTTDPKPGNNTYSEKIPPPP